MNAELALKEGEAAFLADDYPRAVALLLPLADVGHAHAQYLVAEMHRHGEGVTQDAAASVRLYKAAADQGHPRAAMFLSLLLDPLGESAPPAMQSVAKDAAESRRYLDLAVTRNREQAEAGDMQAMSDLGFLCQIGYGVERDGAEAIRWYARVFEAGGTGAANGLCLVYYEGDERVRDMAKARYWYMKTKEFGCQCIAIPEFEPAGDTGSNELP